MAEIVLIGLGLLGGWAGAFLGSYFQEKGKNIATKEDISAVTEQIKNVENRFIILQQKSSALVDRQITAFDAISKELVELQIYCLRSTQDSEHAVPYEDLPAKSTFQRAVHLGEVAHRQRIYMQKKTWNEIMVLTQSVFHLGNAELQIEQDPELGPIDKNMYEDIRLKAKGIMSDMRKELFRE